MTPVRHIWDLLLATSAMLIAAAIAFTAFHPITATISLAILAIVPGYLVIQAFELDRRVWHVVAAVGLSIPLVGLLAAATVMLPGGFTPTSIVMTVTLSTLAVGSIAATRRLRALRAVAAA